MQRVEKGLDPACAANCPTSVFTFGDLDDPSSEVSQALAQGSHFRLLDQAGTKPRVYYVGGSPPGPKSAQIEAVKARV